MASALTWQLSNISMYISCPGNRPLKNPSLPPVSCNPRISEEEERRAPGFQSFMDCMGHRKMQSVSDDFKAVPNAIRSVRASLANCARAQINLALPSSPFCSQAKNNHTTRCPNGNQSQLLSLVKEISHWTETTLWSICSFGLGESWNFQIYFSLL